ncbi:MAG: SctK family type III secretion system sorting platform protein [Puniceicoccales bacterium]|jgi:hypothetical protein|nr:SctK family type III secretion system sorting platform protein [Puniceicoccales bacterium]
MSSLDYIRNTIKEDAKAFSEICDFNDNVVSHIHDDYLAELDCEKTIMLPLAKNPRTRRAISAYVSKRLNLGKWYGDFSEQRYGLCLLTRDDIYFLVNYIGAAIYADEVKKIVVHDELKQLKDQIGPAYNFSIRSADLLFKKSQIDSLALPAFSGSIYDKIVKAGKFVISACLTMVPEDLGRKFVLKFPKTEVWDFSKEDSLADECWRFTKKILNYLPGDKIRVPILMKG